MSAPERTGAAYASSDRLKERLRRLLVMVPWVMEHPGTTVAEVCDRFMITRRELLRDINQIMVCGVYPYSPGDLMWAGVEGDEVVIGEAAYFERPLRLTPGEALSLVTAGRAALGIPGVGDQPALASALSKIEKTMSTELLEGAVNLEISSDPLGLREFLADAVVGRRQVEITYHSASEDEETVRVISPIRVFAHDGKWYVYAWCSRADDYRFFRLDRVKSLSVLTDSFDPSELPDGAEDLDPHPDGGGFELKVRISGGLEVWMTDYLDPGSVAAEPDGRSLVSIHASSRQWAVGLLLRLGSAAEIVEPVDLRSEVEGAAERMLEIYGVSNRSG